MASRCGTRSGSGTRSRKPEPPPEPPANTEDRRKLPATRLARQLALAYHVDRLIESGQVTGYADAARRLGITRSRMSQVMGLLNLSPSVQESLLLGDLHLSERRIRQLVARPAWEEQRT